MGTEYVDMFFIFCFFLLGCWGGGGVGGGVGGGGVVLTAYMGRCTYFFKGLHPKP